MEHKELLAILAARLRELRTARGWTQADVASRARVTRDFVGKAERGEREPSLYVLHKLAVAFGVEPASLISKKGAADDHMLSMIEKRMGVLTKDELEWMVTTGLFLLRHPPPARSRDAGKLPAKASKRSVRRDQRSVM